MKNLTKIAMIGALASFAFSAAQAADMKKVAISTIVEVPALLDTKKGILEGLAEKGFVVGKNITLDYQNANGNMPTQQQIAKKFIGSNPDVIIPITTPTAQAMVAGTKNIPIVFTAVTDPIKAKLINTYKNNGTNVIGVSDAAPIGAQLDLYKELVPGLKKIGFIYNPGLDNALAALAVIKEQGKMRGISVMESPAPTTNEVILATKKLVGKVEAIYVPNDTTVVSALGAIVKIGQDVDLPVFTGETGGVAKGAAASIGLDYVEVGRVTGRMAGDILNGAKPGTMNAIIAYEAVSKFKVAINIGSAKKMGLTFSKSVMDRATDITK